jgi:putative transposase
VHHPPTVELSRLVTSLEGVSSRVLGRDHWPQIPTMLWCEHFWPPSYFTGSVGGPPLSVAQDYIESQKHPG